MDYRRTYEGCQLDPDELAELRQQREAEATAERRREWERAQRGTVIDRDRVRHVFEPPRRLTDLQAAGGPVRPFQRDEQPIGAHPTSKRNGSGFTGQRSRVKAYRYDPLTGRNVRE